MIHKHVLQGCSPTPLAHYLKALGILRLVSQQKDKNCRGAWIDDRFVLATTLTRAELERFFLEEYRPTAFVAPWNRGSGFYQQDDPALVPLERSLPPRFSLVREGIQSARSLIGEMESADAKVRAIKGEAKQIKGNVAREAFKNSDEYKGRLAAAERQFKTLKSDLLPDCRREWRSSHAEWMRAATVLDSEGEVRYPSLLGTGGNDGRLDFTNNFMQRLGELFDITHPDGAPRKTSHSLLQSALDGVLADSLCRGAAIGQYLPGSAGGANSTTGVDGDSLVNPWDFVLMLEGTILFTSAATKQMNSNAEVQASAPFSLRNQAAGSVAMSKEEESHRGEQWLPIWSHFLAYRELQNLLSEGRAQIGRNTVVRPLEMARAIARLGISRGITSFQRYGYFKRCGNQHYTAPLGRVDVRERPHARLIDEVAPWLDRLFKVARDKAPERLIQAERRLADAVFAALTHDDSPRLWQDVLMAAVDIESIQASGTAISCGPIPRLSPEWVMACLGEACGPEERLAVALGSTAGSYLADVSPADRIRHHWLPLNEYCTRFASDKRLAHDVRVVAHGRDPEADLIAVLTRRVVESGKENRRHPALVAAPGAEAHLTDLAAWIAGEVDMQRCLGLARAFMAVDWKRWITQGYKLSSPDDDDLPEDAWMVLKLNALPSALDAERDIPLDPAIVRRLESGDGEGALQLALRRLNAHGIRPPLSLGMIDPALARRFASALAFPISQMDSRFLLNRIQPTPKENSHVR
jgi:CRISPR-associated protein Csx17